MMQKRYSPNVLCSFFEFISINLVLKNRGDDMNLEKSYELFIKGLQSKEDLKNEVLNYAYEQVGRDKYIEAGDFILDFMPRVNSIIDNYNSELACFKHYINRHIKWLMFSFSKAYMQKKEKNDAYQYHYIAEFRERVSLFEEKAEYKISEKALKLLSVKNGKITKDSSRKRLEIFTLKNSRTLTSDQINILAPLINRTPEWLYKVKIDLYNQCEKRIQNRDYLQERHNRLFIEITKDQKKLSKMENGYGKEILFNKMREKQKRKNDMNIKLKKRNCGPKNEEIATLLNIPKGTVDSSLFYIKKALKSLLPGLLID